MIQLILVETSQLIDPLQVNVIVLLDMLSQLTLFVGYLIELELILLACFFNFSMVVFNLIFLLFDIVVQPLYFCIVKGLQLVLIFAMRSQQIIPIVLVLSPQ